MRFIPYLLSEVTYPCGIAVIFEEASGDDDDDADFSAFLSQPLSCAAGGGVKHGTQLMVMDFSQVSGFANLNICW